MPSSLRSSSVRSGRIERSIRFSTKRSAYSDKPCELSHSNPRHPDSPQFWGLLPLGWFRGILRAVPVCHVTIIWGADVSTGHLIAHSKPLGQLVARVDVKVARGDRGAQVRQHSIRWSVRKSRPRLAFALALARRTA